MEIRTAREGLVLKALTDAGEYYELVQANAGHLTRLGDYTELVAKTLPEIVEHLARTSLAFGIRENGALCGAVELLPVEPPKYGLGYWLAENACGRGLATLSCEAVISYARESLEATDVFAGVSHGNDSSAAVLQRAGFKPVRRFDDYTRFHRHLAEA